MNTKSVSKIIIVMMILNIVATCPISVYAETLESVNSLNGKKLIAMFDDGVKFQVEPHTLSQSGWVEVKIIDPGFKEAGLGSISAKSDHQGFKDFTENWKSQVPTGKPVTDTRVWVDVPWEPMGSGKYDIEIEYNGKIYLIDPWWDIDWDRTRKIVFNNFDSSEDLTEIPVKINLNSSHIDWTKINSDYSDIRFIDADNTTVLSYEMVNWNYTGQYAEMWVKVPQIDAGSVIDHIYLYYNNTGASSVENKTDVWSNGYEAVYHFDPGSTTRILWDSTNNDNDGTLNGYWNSTQAIDFDGVDDYVQVSHDTSLIGENFTVTFLINHDGQSQRVMPVQKYSSFQGWLVDLETSGHSDLSLHNGTHSKQVNFGTLQVDTWYQLAFTYDNSTGTVITYNDGVQVQNTTYPDYVHTTGIMAVGRFGGLFYDGVIDELRIYNRTLTPTEILEHYNNYYSDSTGLVLHLDFDGDLLDQSPIGNDGAVGGGSPIYVDGYEENPWSDGKLSFDGVNDHVIGGSFQELEDMYTAEYLYSGQADRTIRQAIFTFMDSSGTTGLSYSSSGMLTYMDSNCYEYWSTHGSTDDGNSHVHSTVHGDISSTPMIDAKYYFDGVFREDANDADLSETVDYNQFIMGVQHDTSLLYPLNESSDELIISNVTRSDDWIEAFADILLETYYSWDTVDTNIYYSNLQNQYINQGFNVECSVTATSPNFMIDTVVFSHNRTGVWVNQTQSFDANPDVLIKNLQIPETKGYKTAYRWYFKNEYGTWNNTSPVTVETIHDVNIIDLMLWGDGAFIGHFVTLILLLVLKRFFGMAGNLMAMVGSVGMMLLTFSTMPSTNPAFIMVIGYVVMTVIAVPWRT